MKQSKQPCNLKIEITVPSTLRNDILQVARSQFGPTQVMPGCLQTRLLQDIEQPDRLTWEEAWSDMERLQQRIASKSFRPILALMDMSTGSPVISINQVTNLHGMEWISAIRSQTGTSVSYVGTSNQKGEKEC